MPQPTNDSVRQLKNLSEEFYYEIKQANQNFEYDLNKNRYLNLCNSASDEYYAKLVRIIESAFDGLSFLPDSIVNDVNKIRNSLINNDYILQPPYDYYNGLDKILEDSEALINSVLREKDKDLENPNLSNNQQDKDEFTPIKQLTTLKNLLKAINFRPSGFIEIIEDCIQNNAESTSSDEILKFIDIANKKLDDFTNAKLLSLEASDKYEELIKESFELCENLTKVMQEEKDPYLIYSIESCLSFLSSGLEKFSKLTPNKTIKPDIDSLQIEVENFSHSKIVEYKSFLEKGGDPAEVSSDFTSVYKEWKKQYEIIKEKERGKGNAQVIEESTISTLDTQISQSETIEQSNLNEQLEEAKESVESEQLTTSTQLESDEQPEVTEQAEVIEQTDSIQPEVDIPLEANNQTEIAEQAEAIDQTEASVQSEVDIPLEADNQPEIAEQAEAIDQTEASVQSEVDIPLEANNQPEDTKPLEVNPKPTTLRKRFDINNEQDFDKLLNYYAKANNLYYSVSGRKHTEEEVKRRKNINEQFKRVLKKKAKSMEQNESGEEFSTTIKKIENNTLFSDYELQEVANNKQAALKLFSIMASGIYEKDGQRTKLTQKQRVALASTLEKVSTLILDKQNAPRTAAVENSLEDAKVLE